MIFFLLKFDQRCNYTVPLILGRDLNCMLDSHVAGQPNSQRAAIV